MKLLEIFKTSEVIHPYKLAKDSNVPYSTIRRITQHEVSCVNQEIAVAILRVFATPEDIIKFIEDYYPESGKAFKEFTSNLGSFAKRDVLDLIADYGTWYAVCLMEKKDGISRDALVNYLGKVKTQKVLDNLLAIDLIEYDSRKLHLKNKNFSTLMPFANKADESRVVNLPSLVSH